MAGYEERIKGLKEEINELKDHVNKEFDKISDAFRKTNTLTDLLYIEIAVLLDIMSKKKIITEQEFADQLKITGDKLTEHMKTYLSKVKAKKAEMDKKLALETKDESKCS